MSFKSEFEKVAVPLGAVSGLGSASKSAGNAAVSWGKQGADLLAKGSVDAVTGKVADKAMGAVKGLTGGGSKAGSPGQMSATGMLGT